MTSTRRIRVIITGRVQGVGFRQAAVEKALKHGLRGWVRNLPQGHVEALAEGPVESVEAFVAWCSEGPPSASVGRVDITEESDVSPLPAFHVEHHR